VKRRTHENYAASLRLHVIPAFGTLKVSQLRRNRLEIFRAEKLARVPPSSA